MENKSWKEQAKENFIPLQAVMAFTLVFFVIGLAWLSFIVFGLLSWWNNAIVGIISILVGLALAIKGGLWAYKRTMKKYFGEKR